MIYRIENGYGSPLRAAGWEIEYDRDLASKITGNSWTATEDCLFIVTAVWNRELTSSELKKYADVKLLVNNIEIITADYSSSGNTTIQTTVLAGSVFLNKGDVVKVTAGGETIAFPSKRHAFPIKQVSEKI